MQLIISQSSNVEKREDGIYVDGIKVLLKDYVVYAIQFYDSLQTKKEAEEVYKAKSAREILEYFRMKGE